MSINSEKISRYCRLCQLNPGAITFVSNEEFISQVRELTKVKINDDKVDVLPKTVCSSCKLSIEEFFLFTKKVQLVDKQLHDYLLSISKVENQLFQCSKCRIKFADEPLLKKHMGVHVEKKQFHCPACPKTYARYISLQLHKRAHPNLYCFNCELTFDDAGTRKIHTCCSYQLDKDTKEYKDCNRQINETADRLPKCNPEDVKEEKIESAKDEFPITEAASSEKKTEDNFISCSIKCEYPNKSKQHQKKPSRSKDNYICLLCNEKFCWKNDFQNHQKIHHETFSCTYKNCSKICTSAYTLRTHLMKHEGKLGFLCVTCGKGFATKNSLTCHEKIHAKVKAYNCDECSIGFSVASNLRAHQRKHHEGVRFYCSQCTRAFITKCSLERHELVHTGIKEFKCETCPAAFYTNKELLKHQRYHQGLRLYKCDQCYKTFFEKHHLTIHIRVHTGERPYVCKVPGCGKSFTESQKLSRHVKARHPPI